MSRDEQQRVCATCGHPKRGHELPRSEGGHGGGSSGRCVTYSCPCRMFTPTDEFKEQEYTGRDLPSWVAEGVKVKVKRTDLTKRYGVRVSGGGPHGNAAWPGEVGVIERVDGIGWWDWHVKFSGGRSARLDEDTLENLVRVRR